MLLAAQKGFQPQLSPLGADSVQSRLISPWHRGRVMKEAVG